MFKLAGYFRKIDVGYQTLWRPLSSSTAVMDARPLYYHEEAELVEGDAAPLQIVAAANKYGDLIICGHRHFDQVMLTQIKAITDAGVTLVRRTMVQGFIDNRGEFHNRVDALAIAISAGQINRVRAKTHPVSQLFSEDLY